MASVAARRLTEAHRLAQLRLGAVTVARMRAIWSLLDPEALDATFQRWLVSAVPIINGQRSASARLAANYLSTFKTMELGLGARVVPVLVEAVPQANVAASMLVTGPVSIKRAMSRGVPLIRAVGTAEAASSATGMRLALNGGRETIIRTLRADRDAKGWSRVASGNACKFCSMLDGKFHYADTADFPAHDGCGCSQEPVYHR